MELIEISWVLGLSLGLVLEGIQGSNDLSMKRLMERNGIHGRDELEALQRRARGRPSNTRGLALQ